MIRVCGAGRRSFSNAPPCSARASKQAVYRGLDKPTLEEAIATTYPAVRELFDSADFVEGPQAFAEKRPPKWSLAARREQPEENGE